MVHIVPIRAQGLTLFRVMNTRLNQGYKRAGIIPSLGQHRQNFEQTYGVEIQTAQGHWHALKFPSEQAYVAALLKFG